MMQPNMWVSTWSHGLVCTIILLCTPLISSYFTVAYLTSPRTLKKNTESLLKTYFRTHCLYLETTWVIAFPLDKSLETMLETDQHAFHTPYSCLYDIVAPESSYQIQLVSTIILD